MRQWWEQFRQHRPVAHGLRAITRFNVRGGAQFAAAISYFSVLSLVPILMLAFSGLGLVLTVVYPGSLVFLDSWLRKNLQAYGDLGQTLLAVVTGALGNWAAIGSAGLVIAVWSGATWIGNLKRASQALMHHDYDNPVKPLPLPLDLLVNFGALLVLFLGVVITWATGWAATNLVIHVLGSLDSVGAGILASAVSVLLPVAAGTLLFWWMFHWFAPSPIRPKLLWIGAVVGAVGLVILQSLASYLIGIFSTNPAAALFGPVIVLMLFMNLFATLILYVAAWLATAEEVSDPKVTTVADVKIQASPAVQPKPGQLTVSSEVAQKSMGVGMLAGYVVGAATGLGLGAFIAAAAARVSRRKG
jgi:membrane protein